MATLDDINILDRVKTDPQLLLQAGRQPTVERVKPTFNPASDYFYNNVLNDSGRRMVDFASSEVNNPFNFGLAGMIGKANKEEIVTKVSLAKDITLPVVLVKHHITVPMLENTLPEVNC
jgi:hypothetical protein